MESLDATGNHLSYHGISWVDVDAPSSETLKLLGEKYGLHPIHLRESTQKVQHSQVEREKDYLFFVLHFPIYHPKSDKISFGQVGIFLGKKYVLTIRSGHTTAIADFFRECRNQGTGEAYFKRGSGYVLYTIISKLLEEISNMTDRVISELDGLEDAVFDNNGSDAQQIGRVRQKIVKLVRLIGPKKIILQDLTEQIGSFSGREMAKYYSNNTKTVSKLWEEVGEAEQMVEIYKDADFTTSTEHTNRILAILTLIFTFTIPVTVVGTLYGMNVLVPGGIETGSWKFFGTYTTFGILVALSTLMAVGMYLYFKKKKWF